MKALLAIAIVIVLVVLAAGFVTGFRDAVLGAGETITVSLAGEPVFVVDNPIAK